MELPPGEVGQIGGRGASLMLGYFDDQEATETAFNATGWFMTGDLGWIDDKGYLRITGRKKDLIIRGGHNIYPARIELLVLRHPAIERAAALPIADERLGEKVCLAVVPRDGQLRAPRKCSTTSTPAASRSSTCRNISSPSTICRSPRAARSSSAISSLRSLTDGSGRSRCISSRR